MKNIILLVLATVLLNSCQNDDDYHYEYPDDEINFPEDGIFGQNILNESTTEFKSWNDSAEAPWYSMQAFIPYNNSLKIVIENTTENSDRRTWTFALTSDWILHDESTDFNSSTEVFIAYGPDVALTKFAFGRWGDSVGSATIKFYKNDENIPFRTKKITWKP